MDISIETETDQSSEATAYRPARRERLLEQHAALAALTKSQVFRADTLDQTFRLLTETAARLLLIERVSLWRYTEDRSAIRCIDLYELSLNRHTAGAEFHSGLYPAYFQVLAKGVLCYEQIGLPVPWLPEDRLFGIAVTNLIVLAIEQSERKQAEAALRESEERLRLAFQAANMGWWDWDMRRNRARHSEHLSPLISFPQGGDNHTYETFLEGGPSGRSYSCR